jgi:putative transposase
MTPAATHATINQIAAILGVDRTNASRRAIKESWPYETGKQGGGQEKKLFPIAKLPAPIRDGLLEQMVQAAPVPEVAEPTLPGFALTDRPAMKAPDRETLTDGQRQAEYARAAILAEIGRLAKTTSKEAAIQTVIKLAAEGKLPPHLQRLVPIANAKKNEKRTLSRRSIYRWMGQNQAGHLAPMKREADFSVPAWGPYLLKLYRQPQKLSLQYCIDTLPKVLPTEIATPHYDAASRWLKKLGNVERIKGRLGPRELRTMLPFTRRTTDGLWPMDIVLPDGHCADIEVMHPMHGQPFRPEMTTYIDIATRRVVGWSVGLAESSTLILDTLRQMILAHGVPCIHYSDRGAYKANLFIDAVTGVLPRLGIDHEFSIAYNSQARGCIERLHKTLWVELARQFSAFVGRDMDKEARQIVFKQSRKNGRHMMAWDDFLKICAERVAWYNAHPHTSLSKITDPDGHKRHQSPDEAWVQAVAEGWEPLMLDADDLDELLPQEIRTVIRGEVKLPWGRYFSHDLKEYNGDSVRVAYDIHDGSQVWVRDADGRLLAIAQRDGNAKPYMPESKMAHARDQREQGKIKRAQRKIDEARAERKGYIDAIPETPLPFDLQIQQAKRQAAELTKPVTESGDVAVSIEQPASVVPLRDTPEQRYAHWRSLDARLQAGDGLSEEEMNLWERYQKSNEFAAQRRKEKERIGEDPLAEVVARRANG